LLISQNLVVKEVSFSTVALRNWHFTR